MSPTPVLKFQKLCVDVDGRRLIEVNDLRILRGECVWLSGTNGAGKTTLLKTIAGLRRAHIQGLQCDGEPVGRGRRGATLRRHTLYIHQQPYLFDRSVEANLVYGLKKAGVGRRADRHQVEEAIEWAGLGDLRQRNARQLSGGERQRVALTWAKLIKPHVLLLDEPTANLDHGARERACAMITDLANLGISVVVASHESQEMGWLADRRWHIERGILADRPFERSDRPVHLHIVSGTD